MQLALASAPPPPSPIANDNEVARLPPVLPPQLEPAGFSATTPANILDITMGELRGMARPQRISIVAQLRDSRFMAGQSTERFFSGTSEEIQARVETEAQQGHLLRRVLQMEYACVNNASIDYPQAFKRLRRMEIEVSRLFEGAEKVDKETKKAFLIPYFFNPRKRDISNTFDDGDITRLYKHCLILKYLSEEFTMLPNAAENPLQYQLAHSLTHTEITSEVFDSLFMHLAAKSRLPLGTVSFNAAFHVTDARGKYVFTPIGVGDTVIPHIQRFSSFNRIRQCPAPTPTGLGLACLKLFFRNVLSSIQYQSRAMVRYWTNLEPVSSVAIFFAAEESVKRGDHVGALTYYEEMIVRDEGANRQYYRSDVLEAFEHGIHTLFPEYVERADKIVAAINAARARYTSSET